MFSSQIKIQHLILWILFSTSFKLQAQQDPYFIQYNQLGRFFNPAFASAEGEMHITGFNNNIRPKFIGTKSQLDEGHRSWGVSAAMPFQLKNNRTIAS